MQYLHLTFFFFLLNFISNEKATKSFTDVTTKTDGAETANLILQSKDGGQTWQDISSGLPDGGEPEGFFAGESDLYVRIKNQTYHSESNLKTPAWEKEATLDPRCTSFSFSQSGVTALSSDGYIYRRKRSSQSWLPIYTDLKSHSVQTVFEAADGSVFLSTGRSLSKSIDKGQTWKLVQKGAVADIVESDGVLLATGQSGIMRSTDRGEHWDWVISDGGVGIALERINGGFAAITYSSSTESRRIHISMDSGKTWKAIDGGLPPSASISSIKQVGGFLLCGHPDGIMRSSDMGTTWQTVHRGASNVIKLTAWNKISNSDRKVFKIYTTDTVLYAVAVKWGC